jgi:hypothetical protein
LEKRFISHPLTHAFQIAIKLVTICKYLRVHF